MSMSSAQLLVLLLHGLASMAFVAQAASKYTVIGEHIPANPGLTYDEWAAEAKDNITSWTHRIFRDTMLVTKQLHEARIKGHFGGVKHAEQQQQQHTGLEAEHTRGAHSMFQNSHAMITCPPPGTITKVGGMVVRYKAGTAEDGHKYLCNLEQLQEGCAALSIGSRGDTSFEEAFLAKTPCTVITLDCTLKAPLKTLGDRHKFYPLCLGSEEQSQANPAFVTLPQLMKKIGKQRVDVLKMDIEGFEWDVIASLGTEPGSQDSLPTQMAIELHVLAGSIYKNSPSYMNPNDFNNLMWPKHAPTFAQFQLLMSHIVSLGYGIVSRDDNPLTSGCSEFLFHRVPM